MRIGINPNKDKELKNNEFFHQVIIPVYIPNKEDYFKESFQIFQICLESLFKTCHKQTYFTIVNNGSCQEVKKYLDELFLNKMIHEIIHTSSIGKLNSVLKGITGHEFQLITITDADVMFLNDWQFETYEIFNNFSKAGVVSPTPSPKTLKHLTHNIIASNFFSKNLKFTDTKNPHALEKFAQSIGNPNFYNKHHLSKNLTITSNNKKAVIGAGHFVATYKGKIFDKVNLKFTNFNLGGDSEHLILDKPAVNQGFWRLATQDNFAYHLGNVAETWMHEVLNTIEDKSKEIHPLPIFKNNNFSKLESGLVNKIFKFIINNNLFWKWFLKNKGLSEVEIKEY